MTDWNLITRLLDFDVLETHEFRRANLHRQLSLDLVVFAFARAFQQWHEDLLRNDLVYLKAAHIANIDSNLHLWLDIAGSHDNALDVQEGTDQVSFCLTHFDDPLLSVLAINDEDLVGALEFLRNTSI